MSGEQRAVRSILLLTAYRFKLFEVPGSMFSNFEVLNLNLNLFFHFERRTSNF